MRGVRFGKLKQRPRSPKSKRGQREGAHHTGIYDSGRVGQQISHYMSTEETMRTYLAGVYCESRHSKNPETAKPLLLNVMACGFSSQIRITP